MSLPRSGLRLPAAASILALLLAGAFAGAAAAAEATLADKDGTTVATATLVGIPAGVLITFQASALPPGVHGFHIHETGACEAPDFTSAGGHFNPGGTEHGFHAEAGPHAGDMPNILVPESGVLTIEVLNPSVTLEAGAPASLFDADGAAIVVHAGADDYGSQPAGDAGARIACGIISE